MKKLIALSLLIAAKAWALTVPLTLPPEGFYSEVVAPLAVSGIPLAGQSVTIDIPFTPGKWIHTWVATGDFFSVLKLLTDANPSNYPSGTGQFLDALGNPIFESPLGVAYSADFLIAGIVWENSTPSDIYGLRYNLTLPTAPASIVGADLKFYSVRSFIVAPIMPDTGSSALLLGCGLFGLFCLGAVPCR